MKERRVSSVIASTNEAMPSVTKEIQTPSALVKGIISFLDNVSYKLMAAEADLESVFRMRHDAYKSVGFLTGSESGLFEDEHDRLQNFRNVGVFVEGRLAACIRLNRLDTVNRSSCTASTYPELIAHHTSKGVRFTDTNRLCVDQAIAKKYVALPFATIRLAGLHAVHHGSDIVLATVKEGHVSFYKKILAAENLSGDPIVASGLAVAVSLLGAKLETLKHMCFDNRQYFFSTPEERASIFGDTPSSTPVRASVRDVIERGHAHAYW